MWIQDVLLGDLSLVVIKHRLSKKYRNLFYWISQVCKNISSVRHAYVSQRHVGGSERGAEPSWLFIPRGWHATISGGQGRAEARPMSPPSYSFFSPNELGTFHCQLFAWVLPFQLAKENWQARLGFSMDFMDILLQIKKKKKAFILKD